MSEKSENVTDNEEILYKVVFYLTTGKIMIQGKAWESICDKHFNKCLQLVNDQYNSKTKASEQETLPKIIDTNTSEQETLPKVIDTNSETDDEETIPKSTIVDRDINKYDKTEEKSNINHINKTQVQETVGETEMQQCFQTLQNRMDIIEEATVKFSSLEAKICDEITDFKKEVLKEIKKIGTKPTNHRADQDSFRQQLHEKDLIIQVLNNKLTLSAQDNKELQDQKKKIDDREFALNKSKKILVKII